MSGLEHTLFGLSIKALTPLNKYFNTNVTAYNLKRIPWPDVSLSDILLVKLSLCKNMWSGMFDKLKSGQYKLTSDRRTDFILQVFIFRQITVRKKIGCPAYETFSSRLHFKGQAWNLTTSLGSAVRNRQLNRRMMLLEIINSMTLYQPQLT